MKTFAKFVLIIALAMGMVSLVGGEGRAQEEKYTFYFVSHIGPADPNMKWLTVSLDDFMARFPEVEIVYVATDEFSISKHVEMLKNAIAAQPDGLIVPMTDPTALEQELKDAIASGIPVIASNISDSRTPEEGKIPYLTYVGGDEYLTGVKIGERLIQWAEKGKVPMPTKAVVAIQHVGHVGLEARAKGLTDALSKVGATTERLAIGDNPVEGKSILNSYLLANPDVNVIFAVAAWTSPWCYEVAKELGMDPDVDDKGVTIVTVDASPAALEGIISGKVLATHSQGFYLQGWVPAEWLYFYNKLGYTPPPEILTGPIIIDETNVMQFKDLVMKVFGEETYEGLILWPEE
jgi:simple sugar transport system substrate-binding protein